MTDTITVRVPLTIRRRGGRKVVLSPTGEPQPQVSTRVDNTLVKALARAFRWQRHLESGTHATVTELAAAERINAAYVGRVLRLALLSPEIVEAVLDGRRKDLMLADLLRAPNEPVWADQLPQESGHSS